MKEIFLTQLRSKDTKMGDFRKAAMALSRLLAAEAATHISTVPRNVETPLDNASGASLARQPLIVLILRAGLAMLPSFIELFPDAPVGFLGIRRNEKDASSMLYYENIPPISSQNHLFLLDPMVATGGSATLAIERLIAQGAIQNQIDLVSIIAAKPGIARIQKQFPDVRRTVAAIDEHLNQHSYIIPGLGDFGDRFFSH